MYTLLLLVVTFVLYIYVQLLLSLIIIILDNILSGISLKQADDCILSFRCGQIRLRLEGELIINFDKLV